MDAQLIALRRPAVCQLTCIPLAPLYERLRRLGRASGRPRLATPLLCQQKANKVSRSITRRQVIAVPGEALIATAAISFAGSETSPGTISRPVRTYRASRLAHSTGFGRNASISAAEALSEWREDVSLWLQAIKA